MFGGTSEGVEDIETRDLGGGRQSFMCTIENRDQLSVKLHEVHEAVIIARQICPKA